MRHGGSHVTEDRSVGDWTGWVQGPAFMWCQSGCARRAVTWCHGWVAWGCICPRARRVLAACYLNRLLITGGPPGAVSTPLGACYAEEVVLGRRQIYLAYCCGCYWGKSTFAKTATGILARGARRRCGDTGRRVCHTRLGFRLRETRLRSPPWLARLARRSVRRKKKHQSV